MPKEQITFAMREFAFPPDGGPAAPTDAKCNIDPTLHVNWRNSTDGDGHVQIMLQAPLSYLKLAMDSPNGDEAETTQLWSPVLDRADINRMIRVLRHARDKSYGRDE